ncbi:MAG: hypothetical protein ACHQIO_06505 [Nevskiales bacterium]
MKATCLTLLIAALAGCAVPEAVPETNSSGRPATELDVAAASRTFAELQEAFDHSKGALVGIYNRAARRNQSLGAGKLIFDLTVEPDGSLSVTMVSSTFGDDAFEAALVERIKQIRLTPRDVPQFTYHNYPIEFRPV